MRSFLLNILYFSLIAIVIHIVFAYCADGSTDEYYLKFSSSKQSSLVLGTSRALQGVIPSVVDSVLDYQSPNLFNFAFTLTSSPYGECYLDAIKAKLGNDTSKGYFIITIDPWSISERKSIPPEIDDRRSVLFGMRNFNSHPNFEYLMKKYPSGWGMIPFKNLELMLLKKNYKKLYKKLNNSAKGSFTYLNNDGWLDVYTSLDKTFVAQKEVKKFSIYKQNSLDRQFSTYRYDYLIKIIEYLSSRGKVYVVRLPVHPEMLQIESDYIANFDHVISTAISKSEGYLDMTTSEHGHNFTDGNHLSRHSANDVSIEIGIWISSSLNDNN